MLDVSVTTFARMTSWLVLSGGMHRHGVCCLLGILAQCVLASVCCKGWLGGMLLGTNP